MQPGAVIAANIAAGRGEQCTVVTEDMAMVSIGFHRVEEVFDEGVVADFARARHALGDTQCYFGWSALILIEVSSRDFRAWQARVPSPLWFIYHNLRRRRPQCDSTPNNIRTTTVSICTPVDVPVYPQRRR